MLTLNVIVDEETNDTPYVNDYVTFETEEAFIKDIEEGMFVKITSYEIDVAECKMNFTFVDENNETFEDVILLRLK